MTANNAQLSLEKFGSIGGDYFEHIIAVALDELGYVEGETYVASWAKQCVPGTWIEADFIVSDKNDKTADPVNNGRFVFAIGHATSENSAQMKFHRDVEQLLEVKSLPNGDEYFVFDILFCCPRETMGGWSKELVEINEAIFDDSLIVWKNDWGLRLLFEIQQSEDQLIDGSNFQKKNCILKLLKENAKFRQHFKYLKEAVDAMISLRNSKSQIQELFNIERSIRKARIEIPLLIKGGDKTEYKRGLLQVIVLHEWEIDLLYENHHKTKTHEYSLEKLAVIDHGMSQIEFDNWWKRLDFLSEKIGKCYRDCNSEDLTDLKRYGCFEASKELAYVFNHFDLNALKDVVNNIPTIAPNLMPYIGFT